jgi:hypothetical protein
MASGQIRNEQGDFWMRRDWIIESIGSMGAELASEVQVGSDGTTRITFRRPSSDKLKLDFEAELFESREGGDSKQLCPAGTVVTVLEESENWLKVRLPSGEEGFLISDGEEGESAEAAVASEGGNELAEAEVPSRPKQDSL